MSDTTHTPGPWHVDPEYRMDRDGFMDGADQVCQSNGDTVAFLATGMHEEEHHSNAHLIAAAPDLLAACKEFVRKCDAGLASSTNSYRQMKAAIDKAEGR